MSRCLRTAASVGFLAVGLASAGTASARPGDLDAGFSGDGRASAYLKGWAPTNYEAELAIGPNGRPVVATEGFSSRGRFRDDPLLARFTKSGRLDPHFSGDGLLALPTPGDDYQVETAVDGRNRILIASNPDDPVVRRLRPDGRLDRSFGNKGAAPVALSGVVAIEVLDDGRILAGGPLRDPDADPAQYDFAVARLTEDGFGDGVFGLGGVASADLATASGSGSPGQDSPLDMAVRADGSVLVAGTTTISDEYTSSTLSAVAAFSAEGALVPDFGAGGVALASPTAGGVSDHGYGGGTAVAAYPSGDVAMAGVLVTETGADFTATRLTSLGLPDGAFAPSGTTVADFAGARNLTDAVAVAPARRNATGADTDRGMYLAGSTARRTSTDFAVLRITEAGRPARSFGNSGFRIVDFAGKFDDADDVAVLDGGDILVSGTIGQRRIGLVRLHGR